MPPVIECDKCGEYGIEIYGDQELACEKCIENLEDMENEIN